MELAVDLGIVEKSGAWFYYNGERLAQGRENARNAIENDPVLSAEIEAKVLEKAQSKDVEENLDIALDALDDDSDELDIRLIDLGDDE